jgi:enediyne biosynthesis protein E4
MSEAFLRAARLAGAPLAAALLLAGCRSPSSRAPGAAAKSSTAAPAAGAGAPVRFTDVTRAAGIRFKHTNGRSGRLYFPETTGAGCAFLDYDNDGHLDLYLVNSGQLPGLTGKGPFYPALYRGRGQGGTTARGRFEEVTRAAGLAVERYGMGVAVGDYDNDGWSDLYLSDLRGGRLCRNVPRTGAPGGRGFVDVTAAAGLRPTRWGTSCAWLDYDRDGWLDLLVANYCVWSPAINKICPDQFGRKHMCGGPRFLPGVPPQLFRNQRNGTFRDVTREAGLDHATGKCLGIAVFDDNHDGWPDLLLANDTEPNLLFRNTGRGSFVEAGVEAGVAYSASGTVRSGMGIDTADDRNDGRESVVIGNLDGESLALYRPDTGLQASEIPHYQDGAGPAGVGRPSLPYSTFGAVFCDVDLDGWKDLLTANGHVDENVEVTGSGVTFAEPLQLFQNQREGQYREISREAGAAFAARRVYRGIARGDMEGDGDPDFLISVCNGAPVLLRNDLLAAVRRHWLWVKPVGIRSNRDGIGTRITVVAGGLRQTGWVRSGSSYCSASDLKAFFGLGAAAAADTVELAWPSGHVDRLEHVPAGRVLRVIEGQGGQIRGRGRKKQESGDASSS